MKEQFINRNFRGESLKWVQKITAICEAYRRQGYRLSVRQIYYQLVAHHGLANLERSYKNMASLISDARMAGLIDWNMVEDRGRETIENNHWTSPASILRASAEQFRYRLWDTQPYHVEVMVEKAALEGVLQPVCAQLDIPFTSNRGYSSSSALYEVGQRLGEALDNGKKVQILYLGDHDPSGLDMTRDVYERLGVFSHFLEYDPNDPEATPTETGNYDEDAFSVERLALNMDQVRRYSPPPNPAKMSDSRAEGYVQEFGYESWELDALDPSVLARLVRDHVANITDDDAMEKAIQRQDRARERLADFAAQIEAEEEEEEEGAEEE